MYKLRPWVYTNAPRHPVNNSDLRFAVAGCNGDKKVLYFAPFNFKEGFVKLLVKLRFNEALLALLKEVFSEAYLAPCQFPLGSLFLQDAQQFWRHRQLRRVR